MNTSIIKSLVEHIGGDSNTISDGTVSSVKCKTDQNKYMGFQTIDFEPFSFINYQNTSNETKKLMFVDNNASSTHSEDGFRAVDVNGNVYEFLKQNSTLSLMQWYAEDLTKSSGYAPKSSSEVKVIVKNIESDFFTPDEIVMASFAAYLKFLG